MCKVARFLSRGPDSSLSYRITVCRMQDICGVGLVCSRKLANDSNDCILCVSILSPCPIKNTKRTYRTFTTHLRSFHPAYHPTHPPLMLPEAPDTRRFQAHPVARSLAACPRRCLLPAPGSCWEAWYPPPKLLTPAEPSFRARLSSCPCDEQEEVGGKYILEYPSFAQKKNGMLCILWHSDSSST